MTFTQIFTPQFGHSCKDVQLQSDLEVRIGVESGTTVLDDIV